MRRLWPDPDPAAPDPGDPDPGGPDPGAPDPGDLDDAALTGLYAPDRAGPRLRVNFVSSLDGAVTLDSYSAGLSGPADKRVFAVLRMLCDALLVGAGTLRHEGYGALRLDEPRRRWRRNNGLAEYPPLIVVSRALTIDPAHPALAGAPVRPIVLTCAASPSAGHGALRSVAEILVHGDLEIDFVAAVEELNGRGLNQLLCEGGPQLFGALTALDLVDELCLTVAPLLAGGDAGTGRITAGPPSPAPRRLALRHVLTADDSLLLRYARN